MHLPSWASTTASISSIARLAAVSPPFLSFIFVTVKQVAAGASCAFHLSTRARGGGQLPPRSRSYRLTPDRPSQRNTALRRGDLFGRLYRDACVTLDPVAMHMGTWRCYRSFRPAAPVSSVSVASNIAKHHFQCTLINAWGLDLASQATLVRLWHKRLSSSFFSR